MRKILMLLLLTLPCWADSIPYVVQPGGQMVSLLGSPTVGPSYLHGSDPDVNSLGGVYLQFSMVALPAGSGTLSLTMDGVTQTVPIQSNGGSLVQGFVVPRGDYTAVPFTLTETMNGQTSVFSGSFVDPVPEPSTLVLSALGLGGILWRKYHG